MNRVTTAQLINGEGGRVSLRGRVDPGVGNIIERCIVEPSIRPSILGIRITMHQQLDHILLRIIWRQFWTVSHADIEDSPFSGCDQCSASLGAAVHRKSFTPASVVAFFGILGTTTVCAEAETASTMFRHYTGLAAYDATASSRNGKTTRTFAKNLVPGMLKESTLSSGCCTVTPGTKRIVPCNGGEKLLMGRSNFEWRSCLRQQKERRFSIGSRCIHLLYTSHATIIA